MDINFARSLGPVFSNMLRIITKALGLKSDTKVYVEKIRDTVSIDFS